MIKNKKGLFVAAMSASVLFSGIGMSSGPVNVYADTASTSVTKAVNPNYMLSMTALLQKPDNTVIYAKGDKQYTVKDFKDFIKEIDANKKDVEWNARYETSRANIVYNAYDNEKYKNLDNRFVANYLAYFYITNAGYITPEEKSILGGSSTYLGQISNLEDDDLAQLLENKVFTSTKQVTQTQMLKSVQKSFGIQNIDFQKLMTLNFPQNKKVSTKVTVNDTFANTILNKGNDSDVIMVVNGQKLTKGMVKKAQKEVQLEEQLKLFIDFQIMKQMMPLYVVDKLGGQLKVSDMVYWDELENMIEYGDYLQKTGSVMVTDTQITNYRKKAVIGNVVPIKNLHTVNKGTREHVFFTLAVKASNAIIKDVKSSYDYKKQISTFPSNSDTYFNDTVKQFILGDYDRFVRVDEGNAFTYDKFKAAQLTDIVVTDNYENKYTKEDILNRILRIGLVI